MNENQIIARAQAFPRFYSEHLLGIEDDTAALLPEPGQTLAWSVDTLVEGTHFLRQMPAFEIGWKSLAVNLSDLAAMNAQPRACLLSLSLPPDLEPEWLSQYFDGLEACCRQYRVDLLGGDTVRQSSGINISLSVLGQSQHLIRRRGAQAGDVLVLTGALGGAAAGLHCFQTQRPGPELLARHWHPQPRFDALPAITQASQRLSMLDTSDGLLRSVKLLCELNQLGCELIYEQIPAFEAWPDLSENLRRDWILNGGEDYELLFSLPAADFKHLPEQGFYRIGQLLANPNQSLRIDGQVLPFSDFAGGFEHF